MNIHRFVRVGAASIVTVMALSTPQAMASGHSKPSKTAVIDVTIACITIAGVRFCITVEPAGGGLL